jgi:hypothetical protein
MIAAVIGSGRQILQVEPADMYSMSSGPKAMNFHTWARRIREIVAHHDRRGRRVEVVLDVVEPQQLTRGRHVQRAVPHRDAVGLREPPGNRDDAVGLVIAVAIDDGVHVAGMLRSDEDGALRPERHLAGVLDLGKHLGMKSRGKDQRERPGR